MNEKIEAIKTVCGAVVEGVAKPVLNTDTKNLTPAEAYEQGAAQFAELILQNIT